MTIIQPTDCLWKIVLGFLFNLLIHVRASRLWPSYYSTNYIVCLDYCNGLREIQVS
jgi:hypothetical protein